jgi:hypothetical protein
MGAADFNHQKCDMAVLLLGAGFSQPWGPPVMSQFIQRATDQYFNHRSQSPPNPLGAHYGHMLDFRRECRGASWLFNRDWDNIEELYTQADLLRLTYPSSSRKVAGNIGAEALCEHIAWAIWDVYRICKVNEPPALGKVLSSIKTQTAKELIPAIITTNYDVLCECGLNHGLPPGAPRHKCFYPGFDDQNIEPAQSGFKRQATGSSPEFVDGVASGRIPIVKLHGSVNWFEAEELSKRTRKKEWLAFQRFGFVPGQGEGHLCGINKPDFALSEFGAELRAGGFREHVVPAIIPPMLGKLAVHPTVAAQWRAAIEILQRARTLDIIGYGFPETDVFMLRLLSEGLRRNEGLEEIMIVNRDDLSEDWSAKLNRFFNRVALEKTIWYLKRDSRGHLGSLQHSPRPDSVLSERRRVM